MTRLYDIQLQEFISGIYHNGYLVDGLKPQLPDHIIEVEIITTDLPSFNNETEKVSVEWVLDIDNKTYTNVYTITEKTTEEIREATVPKFISKAQAKLHLLKLGIFAQVEEMIVQSTEEDKIYWKEWNVWTRDSDIINRFAPYIWPEETEENLDNFFINASKI
jgi:hypothetical protein